MNPSTGIMDMEEELHFAFPFEEPLSDEIGYLFNLYYSSI